MAQFDVHRNPGRATREVPYVVVLQSAWFDSHPRRLVAPLLLVSAGRTLGLATHMPQFEIEGHAVLLDPLQCQPVPRTQLGAPVASLADDESASRIIAAMDEVLTRVYG
ncbi:CcdB family protein [Roseomonas sp. AR75]|uniref:CcdB family protein n=1 Tax=Roseomonas sp. AR75 TaxID=2562311 RepID=UPI0010BFE1C7|nr:CcdB family protein [Roseomonas sp. AR75]